MVTKAYIYIQSDVCTGSHYQQLPMKSFSSSDQSTSSIAWMQTSARRFLQGGSGKDAKHKGQAPEISGRQGWQRRWPMQGWLFCTDIAIMKVFYKAGVNIKPFAGTFLAVAEVEAVAAR